MFDGDLTQTVSLEASCHGREENARSGGHPEDPLPVPVAALLFEAAASESFDFGVNTETIAVQEESRLKDSKWCGVRVDDHVVAATWFPAFRYAPRRRSG